MRPIAGWAIACRPPRSHIPKGGSGLIRGNLITVAAALALSVATYIMADVFPPIMDEAPGPGFVPKILAGSMAVLAFALFVRTMFMIRAEKRRAAALGYKPPYEGPSFSSPAVRLSYKLASVCIVYACLIGLVGFVIASLVFIPSGMWVMGERSAKNMTLVSICMVGGFYLVFAKFLNMTLPTGILFN